MLIHKIKRGHETCDLLSETLLWDIDQLQNNHVRECILLEQVHLTLKDFEGTQGPIGLPAWIILFIRRMSFTLLKSYRPG